MTNLITAAVCALLLSIAVAAGIKGYACHQDCKQLSGAHESIVQINGSCMCASRVLPPGGN